VALVIHRLGRISSTQEEARRLLRSGKVKVGHVVVADVQTGGRGRFGRDWISPSGGLYATFLVALHPQIAILSGVGVLRALAGFGIDAGLKWPNDLVVGEKKLGGILIEPVDEVALVGVGVNLHDAPLETATSSRALGKVVRRGELLLAIGEELLTTSRKDLSSVYRDHVITLGRRVRIVRADGEAIEGTAADIDGEGRLFVRTPSGLQLLASGDCIHVQNGSIGADLESSVS